MLLRRSPRIAPYLLHVVTAAALATVRHVSSINHPPSPPFIVCAAKNTHVRPVTMAMLKFADRLTVLKAVCSTRSTHP